LLRPPPEVKRKLAESEMISKFLRHLRAGTLPAVSKRWLHSRFNAARWVYAGYTIFPLETSGSLKLYRDSRLSSLIRYGDFERAERTFARRFLKPDDVFVDVGANIGLYSVLAAGLVGKQGRVIAFEPSRRTYLRLLENIHRNRFRSVDCVNAALSDASGTTRLYAGGPEMDAWNSLTHSTDGHVLEAEEISTMTWDEYSAQHAMDDRVTLMKIDVEGWETAVLKGARRALGDQKAPVLQVEFCEENARAAGSSCSELERAILELGYELYEYRAAENSMSIVSRDNRNDDCNLYAVKDLDFVLTRLGGRCSNTNSSVSLSQA
jgi:FkbM family methyltransferase